MVDALNGWDWNDFATTLVATLVGAAFGLFGVWLGFRWQARHRYDEVVDDCIVRVLEQIATHATALSEVHEQRAQASLYADRGVDYFQQTGEKALEYPVGFALFITLDVAQMRARGKDQEIVTEAIRVAEQVRGDGPISHRLGMLGLIGGALSRWRSGIWTEREVRDSLARAAALAGPHAAETS